VARGSCIRAAVFELSLVQLERAIPEGQALLLDTSCLSAYFGDELTSPIAKAVVDRFVRSGRNRAIVSAVSAAELLVRPFGSGRADVAAQMGLFFRVSPNLVLVPIDLVVATAAAEIRAREGMKLPDALVAASGLDRSAEIAISDDAAWPDALVHRDARMRVLALRSFLPFA